MRFEVYSAWPRFVCCSLSFSLFQDGPKEGWTRSEMKDGRKDRFPLTCFCFTALSLSPFLSLSLHPFQIPFFSSSVPLCVASKPNACVSKQQ